jgi:hypothetical protein
MEDLAATFREIAREMPVIVDQGHSNNGVSRSGTYSVQNPAILLDKFALLPNNGSR